MQSFAVLFRQGPVKGQFEVTHGRCDDVRIAQGSGQCEGPNFDLTSTGPGRVEATLAEASTAPGSNATIVTLRCKRPFSFFLRDVNPATAILIPAYGVAVTAADDPRCYADIESDVRGRGGLTALQQIEREPEESREAAAQHTRALKGPTWLGLSRDMRLFSVFYNAKSVFDLTPRYPAVDVKVPEMGERAVTYSCPVGRGTGCAEQATRRLDEGCLPILHMELVDNNVLYRVVLFVTQEKSGLGPNAVRGTHFLVADGYSAGHMFTESQQQQFDALREAEVNRDEEPVLCMRVQAVNRDSVPRHAFVAAPWPGELSPLWIGEELSRYDGAAGFALFDSSQRVYSVCRFDGAPMPDNEMAVLLPPGGTCSAEFYLPHQPLSAERAHAFADALAQSDFDQRLQECRTFWRAKLDAGAQIDLPEPVVDEMVKAGLLHLDLVAYGHEPAGTLMPAIGVYCAIGSESSPIIQFFDSMGWHSVAERALHYFLDKQHEDGFIQNFGNYMLETGAALWSLGEHYRYTRDERWARKIAPQLIKACEYMRAWRRRNMRPELRGLAYGMLDGKVGDPSIPLHYFMLNGYACLGMSRAAEMLAKHNPAESERWSREAAALKKDILTALADAIARAPVVPIGDGTWVPTAPPWAEGTAPALLMAEPGRCWTHGTFVAHDSLAGPLYLVLQEVLDAGNPLTGFLQQLVAEVATVRNVATSQPYYSRHDYVHLRRGEVKAFLKTYFNGFTSLADRETYSFWEHYFHASPHKTHEEAWFLMQTRWMLWLEDGATRGAVLRLLPGVPRAWLEDGKSIRLNKVATYFGPLNLNVTSHVGAGAGAGEIEARIECRCSRKPGAVLLRLPHPRGLQPVEVKGGTYDAASETLRIEPFKGTATIKLRFAG
jgi:hypothetical protein